MSTSSTVTNNAAASPTITSNGVDAKDSHYDETSTSSNTTSQDTDKIAVAVPVQDDPRASVSTIGTADPRTQDIKQWKAGFERMGDERLVKQRYALSESKDDEITTTALGAKVERALGRRMIGQDATFTRRESVGLQGGVQDAQPQDAQPQDAQSHDAQPTLPQEPVELPEKRSVEVSS